MISSNVLAAAERNTRQCVYSDHQSSDIWGGLPVVLLFEDDYQLMPALSEGAIYGYSKRLDGVEEKVTYKMNATQVLAHQGSHIFSEVMTENVYSLTRNYRVKCERFKSILGRVRTGRANTEDADAIMNLH